MLDAFAGLVATISGYMYSYILIILLLAAGLYVEWRERDVPEE